VDELCYPYLSADGACGDKCSDWRARVVHTSDHGRLDREDPGFVHAVKYALMSGPVIIPMTVYPDFTAYTSGVYEHVGEAESTGRHAMILIGWNDANDSWIGKNSWGTDWGDLGYFEVRRHLDYFPDANLFFIEMDTDILPAQACISPATRSVGVFAMGVPETVSFTLRSCGFQDLEWTAGADPITGWLSFEPASGTLPVGESTTITVTIDPSSFERTGPWRGGLVVSGGLVDARGELDIDVSAIEPVAEFEAEPTSGEAPLDVTFTSTSRGTVIRTQWEFGDGEEGGGEVTTHTYEEPGVYSVTLEASGPDESDSVTLEDLITVLPAPEPEPEDEPEPTDDASTEGDVEVGARGGCGCSLVS
jgi:hypothetical protein